MLIIQSSFQEYFNSNMDNTDSQFVYKQTDNKDKNIDDINILFKYINIDNIDKTDSQFKYINIDDI